MNAPVDSSSLAVPFNYESNQIKLVEPPQELRLSKKICSDTAGTRFRANFAPSRTNDPVPDIPRYEIVNQVGLQSSAEEH